MLMRERQSSVGPLRAMLVTTQHSSGLKRSGEKVDRCSVGAA